MYPRFRLALPLVSGLLLAVSAGSALAADGAELYKKKTCIACHGADGKAPILPEYPKLAGQSKEYMVRQMLDIKSGDRANGNSAAMKGVMHLVSDDEIAAIAEWLSGVQ